MIAVATLSGGSREESGQHCPARFDYILLQSTVPGFPIVPGDRRHQRRLESSRLEQRPGRSRVVDRATSHNEDRPLAHVSPAVTMQSGGDLIGILKTPGRFIEVVFLEPTRRTPGIPLNPGEAPWIAADRFGATLHTTKPLVPKPAGLSKGRDRKGCIRLIS
jgi:hypothetical protein